MKLKKSFIAEVIKDERKLTRDYLYWIEKFESKETQEIYYAVYRSKTNETFCRGNKLLFASYETVGVYNEAGDRY